MKIAYPVKSCDLPDICYDVELTNQSDLLDIAEQGKAPVLVKDRESKDLYVEAYYPCVWFCFVDGVRYHWEAPFAEVVEGKGAASETISNKTKSAECLHVFYAYRKDRDFIQCAVCGQTFPIEKGKK